MHELLIPVSTPIRVYWLHFRGAGSNTLERLSQHSIGVSFLNRRTNTPKDVVANWQHLFLTVYMGKLHFKAFISRGAVMLLCTVLSCIMHNLNQSQTMTAY